MEEKMTMEKILKITSSFTSPPSPFEYFAPASAPAPYYYGFADPFFDSSPPAASYAGLIIGIVVGVIAVVGGRGTPGYAAPELWMPLPVTHKCDVYSFGILLFEIIGRRRNMDIALGDSQQWFPVCAWDKYEKNQLEELMIDYEIEEKDYNIVERMLKVALCCVQYRPENRPMMSIVVKMLEGAIEVPKPPNPFTHLFSGGDVSLTRMPLNSSGSDWSSFV
ncbi:hypothetical protein L1987_29734 [Smallanthus sonchifolius]|uniref:Uncharacterized protein n=1 Tax=Smallanthus sonchifolius TaxID=185202 RepID=A0ACB9I2A2_9ASTR|nr:hypothetical protein L1987_29734 [Smallanthus sonchifolius]